MALFIIKDRAENAWYKRNYAFFPSEYSFLFIACGRRRMFEHSSCVTCVIVPRIWTGIR